MNETKSKKYPKNGDNGGSSNSSSKEDNPDHSGKSVKNKKPKDKIESGGASESQDNSSKKKKKRSNTSDDKDKDSETALNIEVDVESAPAFPMKLINSIKKYALCLCFPRKMPKRSNKKNKLQLKHENLKEEIGKRPLTKSGANIVKLENPNIKHAMKIQKIARGLLGRRKAKLAWKSAFEAVDKYWDNVKAEREKDKLKLKAIIIARQKFVRRYVADVINTSRLFIVQTEASTVIQSLWRGYYYRSRHPRPRRTRPPPRKFRAKSRHGPDVYRRVWARRDFAPTGGWPGRVEHILEYDIWEHAHVPPAGPDFGIKVFKVKAGLAATSEAVCRTLTGDKYAWVGLPVLMETVAERKLSQNAQWSQLEYLTNAKTPYLTHVVNLKEIPPTVLEGLDLLDSLGWSKQKSNRHNNAEDMKKLDVAFNLDGTFSLENLKAAELSASADVAAEADWTAAMESAMPIHLRDTDPAVIRKYASILNANLDNKITPNFKSKVMPTPLRGAYKPMSSMHLAAATSGRVDGQVGKTLRTVTGVGDWGDQLDSTGIPIALMNSAGLSSRINVNATSSSSLHEDFKGTSGVKYGDLLQMTSYRPKNFPIQFSTDGNMKALDVTMKGEAYPSRYWKNSTWGRLKTNLQTTLYDHPELMQDMEDVADADAGVWRRALHQPKKKITSKAKIWRTQPREHYKFRYTWLPQTMMNGSRLQVANMTIKNKTIRDEEDYEDGDTVIPRPEELEEKTETQIPNPDPIPVVRRPLRGFVKIGAGEGTLPIQIQTSSSASSFVESDMVELETLLRRKTRSRNKDRRSADAGAGKDGGKGFVRPKPPSNPPPQNMHMHTHNMQTYSTITANTIDIESETGDKYEDKAGVNVSANVKYMTLASRSKAIDRVDVYDHIDKSHLDTQLSDLTHIVRSEMKRRLKMKEIIKTTKHKDNTNTTDCGYIEKSLVMHQLYSTSSFPFPSSEGDNFFPSQTQILSEKSHFSENLFSRVTDLDLGVLSFEGSEFRKFASNPHPHSNTYASSHTGTVGTVSKDSLKSVAADMGSGDDESLHPYPWH